MEESKKRATDAAAQLATSFRRITKGGENARKAADKVADIQRQTAVSKNAADDVLRRIPTACTKMWSTWSGGSIVSLFER